jgi:hypothetical protein
MQEEMLLRAPRIRNRSPIFPLDHALLEPLFIEDENEMEFRLEAEDSFDPSTLYSSINESATRSCSATCISGSWLKKIEAKQLSDDSHTNGLFIYSLMIEEKKRAISNTVNLR